LFAHERLFARATGSDGSGKCMAASNLPPMKMQWRFMWALCVSAKQLMKADSPCFQRPERADAGIAPARIGAAPRLGDRHRDKMVAAPSCCGIVRRIQD